MDQQEQDFSDGMAARHDPASNKLLWVGGEYIIVTGFTKEEIELLSTYPAYAAQSISMGFDRSREEIDSGDSTEEHS